MKAKALIVLRIFAHLSYDGQMFTSPDPAERSLFMRLCYHDRRPTWFGHLNSQFFCRLARLGLLPDWIVALEVPDRTTGSQRSDAVVTPTVNGQRYIVSMFGVLSDWVQNLEASGGNAVIYHRRPRPVRLLLIPPKERAPIIQEFARIALSGRKHLSVAPSAPLSDFAAIAALHPVYRIEALEYSNQGSNGSPPRA